MHSAAETDLPRVVCLDREQDGLIAPSVEHVAHAGHTVRYVIMGATLRAVVDQLLARARHTPFQAEQLLMQNGVIGQLQAARRDERQQLAVERRFR